MKVKVGKSKPSDAARHVRIVGEGLDEWGNRYVKLRVRDSAQDIPPFKVADLVRDPTRLFAALANAGWNGLTPKARHEVLKKLEERKRQAPSFTVATRLGWNGDAFVLPDQIFGDPEMPLETVFGDLDHTMLAKYRTRGSLKEWQDQVAARCTGNSRLIFSVFLAFTGPVLRFVGGPKGGGFQLWGDAETGKTTSAMVAGSVWGSPVVIGANEGSWKPGIRPQAKLRLRHSRIGTPCSFSTRRNWPAPRHIGGPK
jgi:putative DNA primase/helicase